MFILFFLAACSPNVETRGHLRDPDWQAQVQPDRSTREDVLMALGSPSSRSSFGEETWYYITTKRESFAFLRPEIKDEDIIRITFHSDGLVKSIEQFDGATAQDVQFATRETPTEGHQMTFTEQLLGNLGRFNSPGSAAGGGPASSARRSSRP